MSIVHMAFQEKGFMGFHPCTKRLPKNRSLSSFVEITYSMGTLCLAFLVRF